jgi:N,N-dimethylformamidase beta subunit-like, C-terminal
MLLEIILAVVGAIVLAVFLCGVIFLYDYVRYKIGLYTINPGPVSGFAGKCSYVPGESIDLYIFAIHPLTLRLYRLDAGWTPLERLTEIPAKAQSRRFSRWRGLAWQRTVSIGSEDLAPGLYRFHLCEKGNEKICFDIPVIIRDKARKALCVILATNTWQSYNYFGGISHYENHYIGLTSNAIAAFLKRPNWCSHVIPMRRPNQLFSVEVAMGEFGQDYTSFTIRNELEFLMFLTRNGFSYSVYSDDDLAHDPTLQEAGALVFPGHSEYWTDDMYYALERYIEKGGKVYFSNSELDGHCDRTADGLLYWPRTSSSVSNSLAGTHPTLEGAFTAAPYRVVDEKHWIFESTNLKKGDLFGIDCANHPSFDAVGHRHLRNQFDLRGKPQCGASGFFTSKVGYGSGAFRMLAEGTNPTGGAHMVVRDLPSGGWVFTASSLAFNGSLSRDQMVAQIVRNLMANACSVDQNRPEAAAAGG